MKGIIMMIFGPLTRIHYMIFYEKIFLWENVYVDIYYVKVQDFKL